MLIIKHGKNDRCEVPSDVALEQIAKMPEDVKKMAVAYAYGLMMARQAAAARETR